VRAVGLLQWTAAQVAFNAPAPSALPTSCSHSVEPLITPDGRDLIVRGRLWRATNPGLGEQERQGLVNELRDARWSIKTAKASGDVDALATARQAVDSAKRGLGERGPVWWNRLHRVPQPTVQR